uniref:Global nitrogen regulator NrpRI n=2 Tax=Candidatus Methanogaster sp. ANME-2c ERB4 TaxID=2759911 RepID=A0A7G9Y742_9EURY|nr:global nitrogen regulator NrpRI [Methanosarcinales archaeon ANME-2c ERB4]QNO44640.1 global nitrogen regulator NrpRI [Methanosarcinales archaeon ANME-2c ERB4]
MISSDDPQIQRKLMEILRVIYERESAVGARIISDVLKENGYPLGERGVRYHLRILDERGLTERHGYAGRTITELGKKELEDALVQDRIGFVLTQIEKRIYQTDFDLTSRKGLVIANIAIIEKDDLDDALGIIRYLAEHEMSCRVKVINEEATLPAIPIPEDHIAIATICSTTCDGILLKHGIPVNIKYGGMLRFDNNQATSYTDLIAYTGTSIDPMKIFISRSMTSVLEIVKTGSGLLLANVREVPDSARDESLRILNRAMDAGIIDRYEIGDPGSPVLGVPVNSGMTGISVSAGLNAIAAVQEVGIKVTVEPVAAVMNYSEFETV